MCRDKLDMFDCGNEREGAEQLFRALHISLQRPLARIHLTLELLQGQRP